MEPDKMHPRVQREDISNSLSLLKSHDSQAKSPESGKGKTLHPLIKCVTMDILRTVNEEWSLCALEVHGTVSTRSYAKENE